MKKRELIHSLLALSLAALIAPAAANAATTPVSAADKAPILYTHIASNPDGSRQSYTLFRVDPVSGAVKRLTQQTAGVFRHEASWSPGGTHIAYTRTGQDPNWKSSIFTMDANGGNATLLVRQPGSFGSPKWGPGGLIGLVNHSTQCLSVVKYDGTGLRTLVCADTGWRSPYWQYQWSQDGKTIMAAHHNGGLESDANNVYRVNVATGASTMLFYWQSSAGYNRSITLSPDGTHGIYNAEGDGSLTLVDFATGAKNVIGHVGPSSNDTYSYYGQRYSPDGSHVAFLHNRGLYVMRADGTDLRLISPGISSSDYDEIGDWSGDGSRILLEKVCFRLVNGQYTPHTAFSIVDVATHAVTPLSNARESSEGSWFHP